MDELAVLGGFANHVSMAQTGLPTTRAGSLASAVFAKCCAHARSIGAIATQSSMFDHHAIVALARMIVEATTVISYLNEPVSPDEWELRDTILRLQDTVGRITLLRGFDLETDDLRNGREELRRQLQGLPSFKKLPPERQDKLLTGEQMFVNGMRSVAKNLMGWDEERFTALYNYMSAHTHSGPVSFMRMERHGVDYYAPSDAQRDVLALPMEAAIACLRRVTLRQVDQRPDQINLYQQELLAKDREKDSTCPFFRS